MPHAAPGYEAKLCPPGALAARLAGLPRPLVFTNGCFDILHRGHATYLAQARA
ncbi:partial D-glycero-beta-D-manno-heptose 1-phosphate adenylyltransferase, partial [Rhodocyclaceae bacterium]